MKCLLMNKNIEVLVADYDPGIKTFFNIIEIKNIDYAPIIIKSAYEMNDDFRMILNTWFKGRGIPTFRDKLDILLARLDVVTPEELLDKAYGLSLSDQYFLKPFDSDIKYDDINFFDHDFSSAEFLEASFSNISKVVVTDLALKTPNNTTDGMLRKSWIIDDKKRYLLKAGYNGDYLQPFNEVLASIICEKLGFNHVEYTLDVVNNNVVSKCLCFINKDTEFVPASQLMYGIDKHQDKNNYEEYIRLLEENGIGNAREKVEDMYILDFLIMNEDRHLNNFGVIRDVNTLEWVDVAPIFDNGCSLNMISYDNGEIVISGEGRLFYNILSFDDIIKIVKNIKRIDFSKLDGVVEEYEELLYKYKDITGISDERINKLCVLLDRQIEKLRRVVEK